MGGVSSGTAATIVIVVFILIALALSAELAYVCWYRKKFKTSPPYSGAASETAAPGGEPFGTPDSKELVLYQVLCEDHHRHQLRSERAPFMADSFYSFAPPLGYSWSLTPSPEKREKEEEREFEFVVEVERETPFHTPWSSPARLGSMA